jgi:hypothetical protein
VQPVWPLVIACIAGALALLAGLVWLGARAFEGDFRAEGDTIRDARSIALSDLPTSPTRAAVEGQAAGEPGTGPLGGAPVVWWEVLTVRHFRRCTGSGSDRRCSNREEVIARVPKTPGVQVRAGGRVIVVPSAGADLARAVETRSQYPGGRDLPYIERRQRALAAGAPLLVVGEFSRGAGGEPRVRAIPDVTLLWGGTKDQVLDSLADDEATARTVGRVAAVVALVLLGTGVAFLVLWLMQGRRARRAAPG